MSEPAAGVPGRKPVGIKEVAALAGVSWKTVSNVVNQRPHVAPATRDRVLNAIAELEYRPNVAGRQLRQGSSKTIVLAIPGTASPYFGRLAEEIIQSAATRGYTVLIEVSGEDPAREQAVLAGYRDRLVDGIIYSPVLLDPAALSARTDRTPLVLLGEGIFDSGYAHVAIDNKGSAADLVTHLAGRGRRRLGFIGASYERSAGAAFLRLEGFREGLESSGLEFDARLVLESKRYTREAGEELGLALLNSKVPCDAVICGNDLLAVGVMRAFRRRGVEVPQDISVAGWDDIPEAEFGSPTLTTIAPDMKSIAETACELVVAEIEGRPGEKGEIVIGHRLKVRESTS